jgi:ABC-type bacteriocin/lantibiotic exporter with double-glycine peptidase domain
VELAEERNPPGELGGAIELGQVTFRYAPGGPTSLAKITLQVGKGEYVAVVGPSGSGKSTLFRLLLGFEKPESGKRRSMSRMPWPMRWYYARRTLCGRSRTIAPR